MTKNTNTPDEHRLFYLTLYLTQAYELSGCGSEMAARVALETVMQLPDGISMDAISKMSQKDIGGLIRVGPWARQVLIEAGERWARREEAYR